MPGPRALRQSRMPAGPAWSGRIVAGSHGARSGSAGGSTSGAGGRGAREGGGRRGAGATGHPPRLSVRVGAAAVGAVGPRVAPGPCRPEALYMAPLYSSGYRKVPARGCRGRGPTPVAGDPAGHPRGKERGGARQRAGLRERQKPGVVRARVQTLELPLRLPADPAVARPAPGRAAPPAGQCRPPPALDRHTAQAPGLSTYHTCNPPSFMPDSMACKSDFDISRPIRSNGSGRPALTAVVPGHRLPASCADASVGMTPPESRAPTPPGASPADWPTVSAFLCPRRRRRRSVTGSPARPTAGPTPTSPVRWRTSARSGWIRSPTPMRGVGNR